MAILFLTVGAESYSHFLRHNELVVANSQLLPGLEEHDRWKGCDVDREFDLVAGSCRTVLGPNAQRVRVDLSCLGTRPLQSFLCRDPPEVINVSGRRHVD